MQIIIAGAGRVGHLLAQTLSAKHDVTIIDKDAKVLEVLQESVDLLPIVGNIEDPDTYATLLHKRYDIFIAVTDSDEANLLSTLIADDVIDAKRKIIRLRNAYFAKSSIAGKLGIDDAVFPYSHTADSIKALIQFPYANNVKSFAFTPMKLISIYLEEEAFVGSLVGELENEYIRIVGIERNKCFILPHGDERLQKGDLLYFFGNEEVVRLLGRKINSSMPDAIKKIAIFGANPLGLEIARTFCKEGNLEIKLIEQDSDRALHAAEVLQDGARVINSRYIEHTIFEEELISEADMVISTHTKDELNIIQSLEAQEWGVPKTVAINNKREYYDLMHKLGIVVTRGPKMHTFYAIIEKISSSSVIVERHYCGGNATLYVRKIFPNSHLIGKKMKLPKHKEITVVLEREGVFVALDEPIALQENDLIALFSTQHAEEKAQQWIYSL